MQVRRPRGTTLCSLSAYDSWCGVAHGCTRKIGLKICGKSTRASPRDTPHIHASRRARPPPGPSRRGCHRARGSAGRAAPAPPPGSGPRCPLPAALWLRGPGADTAVVLSVEFALAEDWSAPCGTAAGPAAPPAVSGGVHGPAGPGGGSAGPAGETGGEERAEDLADSHGLKFFNLI